MRPLLKRKQTGRVLCNFATTKFLILRRTSFKNYKKKGNNTTIFNAFKTLDEEPTVLFLFFSLSLHTLVPHLPTAPCISLLTLLLRVSGGEIKCRQLAPRRTHTLSLRVTLFFFNTFKLNFKPRRFKNNQLHRGALKLNS